MARTTADLLAELPPLPQFQRPFVNDLASLVDGEADNDFTLLRDLVSGHYLDYLLTDVLAALPEVRAAIDSLGPAGLVMRARPTNTMNALTVRTRDGVLIIYNIGFYSLLYSLASAVSWEVQHVQRAAQVPSAETVEWLAVLADWATSLAQEPRIASFTPIDDHGTTATLAGYAQRFALCHELGHVLALSTASEPLRSASVQGVQVDALATSWQGEYDADSTGLDLLVQLYRSQDRPAGEALVGAVIFCEAAAIVAPAEPTGSDHPPADERVARIGAHFADLATIKEAGAAIGVRELLYVLRERVRARVQEQRSAVTAELNAQFAAYASLVEPTEEQRRTAAWTASRLLLRSPGATLEFLRGRLFAPMGDHEAPTGSVERRFAADVGVHLEQPLQDAIGLSSMLGKH